MSIRNRIFGTLLALATSLIVVGALGLYGMNGLIASLDTMFRQRVVAMEILGELRTIELDRQSSWR